MLSIGKPTRRSGLGARTNGLWVCIASPGGGRVLVGCIGGLTRVSLFSDVTGDGGSEKGISTHRSIFSAVYGAEGEPR